MKVNDMSTSKKMSLKEFHNQIEEIIYEVLEEELSQIEKEQQEEESLQTGLKNKDFVISSTGNQIYKDSTNPEIYDHERTKDKIFWPKNFTQTRKIVP